MFVQPVVASDRAEFRELTHEMQVLSASLQALPGCLAGLKLQDATGQGAADRELIRHRCELAVTIGEEFVAVITRRQELRRLPTTGEQ